jgi:hypothetical protein
MLDEQIVYLLRKIFKALVVLIVLTATFTSIEVAEAFFGFEGWDLLG